MGAAIGQSYDIPLIIRILASHTYFEPEGSTIISDREFCQMIDAGTSADDPSAVADSYIRDWWNSDSPPEPTDNLHYDILHQALDHHRHVTGKKQPLPPKSLKERYTWSRDLSCTPQGVTLPCENCRLYRGIAMNAADKLHDMYNHIHGIEARFEHRGNMSERRAAGFYQLYEGVLMKELNDNPSKLVKGKSKESTQDKSHRVQKFAADELARLETLPSLKWTWGTELSAEEAIRIGKHNPVTNFRQHSGYNISLPWGHCGEDSAVPDSFPSSQLVSEIDEGNLEIPELNVNDIPHHFTSLPLRHELDEVPSERLPRFATSDSPIPDAANVFSDSEPENTLALRRDPTTAAMDVFSDLELDDGLSAADIAQYPAADVFEPDSDPDIRIGIHSLSLASDSHLADQVFSSSDSYPENPAADVFSSSDANSDILVHDAIGIPMISVDTGHLSVASPPLADRNSDDIAAGDIYSSEGDGEDLKSSPNASNVFTSSDSDSEEPQAADVFHLTSDDESEVDRIDDESGMDRISAILGEQLTAESVMEANNRFSSPETASVPIVQGPFNPAFFSSFPNRWMDPIHGDEISDGDSIDSDD